MSDRSLTLLDSMWSTISCCVMNLGPLSCDIRSIVSILGYRYLFDMSFDVLGPVTDTLSIGVKSGQSVR
jgi:hypothetical protein